MKIKDFFIELKVRLDRGNAIIYWFKNAIVIAAAGKYLFGENVTLKQIILLGAVLAVVIFLIGVLDMDLIKFRQREEEIKTEKYNYYFGKLKKKVERGSRK